MASAIRGYRLLMAAAKTTTTATASVPKRGRPAGILKVVPISQPLGQFLGGVSEVSRTDAVKKVWEYIKHNNLQNHGIRRADVATPRVNYGPPLALGGLTTM